MKKVTAAIISALALFCTSCASLQNDINTSREENAYIYSSIEIYEYQFINLDAEYSCDSQPNTDCINLLLNEITSYRTSTNVTEPFLIARLLAFEGLLNNMLGKNRDAEEAYQEAKNLQRGDRYVQLLQTRLTKSKEASLSAIEKILTYDENNSVLLLEKGKLLYQLARYNEAVATIDNAFLLFDSEGYMEYRKVYAQLRNNAWELNSISKDNKNSFVPEFDLQGNLTLLNMLELTLLNSSLLEAYRPAKIPKTKFDSFVPVLQASGYFNSPSDPKNEAGTAVEFTSAKVITRRLCARFIWNAYVRSHGNINMLSRYSEKYKKSNRTKSPIADIPLDDKDFDAVLGVIENEFMELPDGRSFSPDTPVTNLQFITWIKKADR